MSETKGDETGLRIVRNPDAVEEPIDNIEFDFESVKNFVAPRATGSMIFGGLGGMTMAFIAGESIALPFYGFGLAGAIFGTTFHAGSYALRYYRKQNDMLNYASCGAVHGLVVGCATKGLRKGGPIGLGCGIAGAAYFVLGDWLYDVSRQAWITHKKNMAKSQPRIATTMSHPFEPRPGGFDDIPNRYSPIPDDDHSWVANCRRYLQKLDREEAEKRSK